MEMRAKNKSSQKNCEINLRSSRSPRNSIKTISKRVIPTSLANVNLNYHVLMGKETQVITEEGLYLITI
jgi:hypothetical protein